MLQKGQPSPVPQSRMSKAEALWDIQAWLNFSIETHVTNLLQRIFDFLDSWLLLFRATLWVFAFSDSVILAQLGNGTESLSCNQSSPGARSKEQLAKPTSLESHSSTDQIRVFLRVSLIQTSLKFFLEISRGLFYKRVSRFASEFLKRSFVPKRVLGFSLECKVYLRYYDRLRRLFVSNTINS